MRLGKTQLALGILVFGLAAAVMLTSKAKDQPLAPVAKATPQPQVETKAQVEETASPVSQAPVRHEDALEMIEALKDFDGSFKAVVDNNRQDFAARLILRKIMGEPPGNVTYKWLTPLMNEHDFLWHDPMLVNTYWTSCVTVRCDRQEFKSRLKQKNPGYLASREVCLESWADMMVLIEKMQTVTEPEIQGLKPKLKQCLAQNGVTDDTLMTQLQFYLGLVQMKQDRGAADAEYESLKESIPDMPDFTKILPQ